MNPDELARDAWAAMTRQDWDEALRCWATARDHFPDRTEGYVWAIQVLWQTGRVDEAELLARQALARFPDNPDALIQNAWVAMARHDWDEGLRRWAKVCTHSPERPDGFVWTIRAHWQAGRLDRAERAASEALARFPDSPDALAESAWVAMIRQEWQAAARRWSIVRDRFPERPDGHVGFASALRQAGSVIEAEAVISAALARFPERPDVVVEHVWTALAREDWTAATERLAAARKVLADDNRYEANLGAVEYRLRTEMATQEAAARAAREQAENEPRRPLAPGIFESPDAPAVRELMLGFESIGERCDFGAVQRYYGAEPLGLLRFSYARLDSLIAALGARFEAVGTEEDTVFEQYHDENIILMKRYGLVFHTFVYNRELNTPEKRAGFRDQQRRRLTFLKRKLVDDLEEAEKIFVYGHQDRVSDEDAVSLLEALRRYGPNRLLVVRPRDEVHAPGSLEALRDGLFIGYVEQFADFIAGEQPPFETWRAVCERTRQLCQTQNPRRLVTPSAA